MPQRPWTNVGSNGLDAAIGLVLTVGGQLEVWLNGGIHPKLPAAVCELVIGLGIIWRRRAPLAVVLTIAVALAAEAIAGVPLQSPAVPPIAAVIAFYTLVTHASRDRALVGAIGLVAAFGVMNTSQHKGAGNYAYQLLLLVGTWGAGRAVRVRSDRTSELERRAEALEREQEQRAAIAAEEERRRIARELHDIISHSLGVLVLQAGAAEKVLDRDPERVHELLRSIRETARQAIGEMGTLLSLVRVEPESSRTPPASLDDLEPLLARARAAGRTVSITVEGDRRELPAPLELSAFRIAQEGVTNALKHGGDARVRVVIRYRDRDLEVEVSDDGPGFGNGSGSRRGLAGISERVTVFGGRLDAGPRPEGGWTLRAVLPLND